MGKSLQGKELGEGISQRTDGTYMARFTNRFGKRICVYDKTLKGVKAKFTEAMYEDKKKLNLADDTILLDTWFEKWISIHKYNTIKANTKRRYIEIYKKHIAPTLGKRRLCDINQLMIRELLKNLDKNGYKFETKNKVKILLVDMFDKAILDDFARKNPARGIKIVKKEAEEKEVRVLSVEEQQTFFECCKGTFYDNLFTVAVHTGLRPGELCALTWDDIDFEKNELSVTKTLLYQKLEDDEKKEFHIETPKTKTSKRKVPLDTACILALKKQRLQSEVVKSKSVKFKDVPDEFKSLLFTTKFATPINSEIFCSAIERVLDEINLTRDSLEQFEVFSPHCFRHTFATRAFESGIQPKTVQNYLGHATLQMTMDLYTHVLDTHKQEEMSKLELHMNALENVSEEEQNKALNRKLEKLEKSDNLVYFAVAH